MKFKKIIIEIFIIVIAFAVFVTWYEKFEKNSAQTVTSQQQKYKIYLITMDKVNRYWYYIDEGARAMAALQGVDYIWDAPQVRDVQTQITILNNAVEQGADAILISPIDADQLAEPVRNAKERGVKVIYVDAPAKEKAVITLATDNYKAGRIAGENMIEELELQGIREGKIGIVGINPTTVNTINRENGFRDVIKEDGRYSLLDTMYANSDLTLSLKDAEQLINENKDIVGLFGTDEISSTGVGRAIKEVNNSIVGIGFDQSEEILNLMNEESLKAVIVQNPFTMGYLGIAEAVAALEGLDTGPDYIDTGVTVQRKR